MFGDDETFQLEVYRRRRRETMPCYKSELIYVWHADIHFVLGEERRGRLS